MQETQQRPVLNVDGLDAGYGEVQVLRDVSFELYEGELLSIIGPNGAGKTTLMRALMGIIIPDSGSIRLGETDLTTVEPNERVAQGVSLISEKRNLFRDMTVAENLKLGTYLSRDDVESSFERIYDLFPRLDERRDQKAGTLSGGEAQMLALGRGLMKRPRVLLLDEPSLGLAPLLIPELFDKITTINENGVSVVLVEQRARKALEIADRGCLLENGEITYRDDAVAMLDKQSVVEQYLGGA
ncbi:ABC transporter ATP-binding protein [Natrinema gelatinilyticum]|uniref:ABC transporter ATP-binding protein n=1 Tax=Natrinema gelatinilyticum TaxID=2961571 RepID=UPI0020C27CBD|nr:ABC transporter ATP-binding protein [Natrinema gelatinilyticum]